MHTPHRPLAGAALAAALSATLLLTGCSGGTAAQPGAGDGSSDALRVVVTTTQLADFTAQVGGDDIELTSLLPVGASAHHFDPSPKELLALSKADVLVVNGAQLEGFIDSAIEASGFSGTVITAADGIDLEEAREITARAEHEAEHQDEGADDHDHADGHDHADEHAAHSHDDHDHGDTNPHLWTSPRYAADMTAEIARGLAAADSKNAAAFEERAAAYSAELDALDEWVAAEIAKVPAEKRVLVSGHDSLRYFLHDYDITFAGAIIPSFEDNAEPSAAQIDALVTRMRDLGVTAVFVESSMNPKLSRTIAREAGVAVMDEESLYADSLGAPGSGAENYVAATVHNTKLMLQAWGETPSPLPAELEAAALEKTAAGA